MSLLTQDYGPAIRARQRAQRERAEWLERHWPKIISACALWVVVCFALMGVTITKAFAFPTLAYIHACQADVMDCTPAEPATVPLSVDIIGQLEGLRDTVTYRFVLREEDRDAWDASGTFADCEDIALFYQQQLLAQGHERGAFRFGQGQLWNGQRHVFLVVFTDQGPIAIDAYQIVMLERLDLENIHIESHTDCNQQSGCTWNRVYPTEQYVATMQDRAR